MANPRGYAIGIGRYWWQHRGFAWNEDMASYDHAQEVQIWHPGYYHHTTVIYRLFYIITEMRLTYILLI